MNGRKSGTRAEDEGENREEGQCESNDGVLMWRADIKSRFLTCPLANNRMVKAKPTITHSE